MQGPRQSCNDVEYRHHSFLNRSKIHPNCPLYYWITFPIWEFSDFSTGWTRSISTLNHIDVFFRNSSCKISIAIFISYWDLVFARFWNDFLFGSLVSADHIFFLNHWWTLNGYTKSDRLVREPRLAIILRLEGYKLDLKTFRIINLFKCSNKIKILD